MECLVLYNKNNDGSRELRQLIRLKSGLRAGFRDWSGISDFKAFSKQISPELNLVFCGSDTELNLLINSPGWDSLKNPLYFFPAGEKSDLIQKLKPQNQPEKLRIDGVLRSLPVISVKGRDYRFINGISWGLDAKTRLIREEIRENTGSCPSNSSLRIKKQLLHEKSCGLSISVDGISRSFRHVWLASALNGCCLNGMRLIKDEPDSGMLQLRLLQGCGRFGALLLSGALFRGRAESLKRQAPLFEGHDITLSFRQPVQLYIDGRALEGVSSCRLRSAEMMKSALPVLRCIPEAAAN